MSKGMPEGVRTAMCWVLGIGIIALILLILLILFGNLQGNIGFGTTSSSFLNETVTLTSSGVTLGNATGRINPVLSGTYVTNATDGTAVPVTNYTVTGATLTATTGSDYTNQPINVSATITYDTNGKVDTDNVITNFSKSATNVSQQLPTVGTIIGVALLLVVLIGILVFAIRKMMGVAGRSSGKTTGSLERANFG